MNLYLSLVIAIAFLMTAASQGQPTESLTFVPTMVPVRGTMQTNSFHCVSKLDYALWPHRGRDLFYLDISAKYFITHFRWMASY